MGGAECSLECWSSQPPFPSQAAFYLLLFVASDIWVKMLNYLAAVVRWILKQLTSAKNGQLALSLLDFAKESACFLFVCQQFVSSSAVATSGLRARLSLSECQLPEPGSSWLGWGLGTPQGFGFFFAFLVFLLWSWGNPASPTCCGWIPQPHIHTGDTMQELLKPSTKGAWGLPSLGPPKQL